MELAALLHYITIAIAVGINAVSVGIGEGITSMAAIDAIHKQPSAQAEITKLAMLGIALVETAAIIGVSIALVLLFSPYLATNYYAGLAELGIAAAVGLPGFFVGIFSALPAQAACLALARQPFFGQKILRFMLITQSLIQTPIIFGFIFAMYINNQIVTVHALPEALKLIATGLCIGLGSIGPVIGMARFAQAACEGIGVNRNIYSKMFTFMFISEAIIETPVILALVVSMLLISAPTATANPLLTGIAMLSAALSTGIGTLGPGISSGKVAMHACKQLVQHPEQYSVLLRTSLFGQGLIDTCAIYALLISIMLIVWV